MTATTLTEDRLPGNQPTVDPLHNNGLMQTLARSLALARALQKM